MLLEMRQHNGMIFTNINLRKMLLVKGGGLGGHEFCESSAGAKEVTLKLMRPAS
jgi:hypothetical protein